MNYYKIDVPGKNGYSFMICSDEELDYYGAIGKAFDNNLFNDIVDSKYAEVDDLVSEYDVNHFEQCGCLHKV